MGRTRRADWHLVCWFLRKISEDRYSKDVYKKKVMLFFHKIRTLPQNQNLSNTASLPRQFGSAAWDTACFALEDSTTQQDTVLEI